MAINKHLERLRRMHQLIKFKRTGTPEVFAEKLGLSQSLLYRLLSEMKALGAPVHFCHSRQSYVYYEPVELQLGFVTMRTLSEQSSHSRADATVSQLSSTVQAAQD